MEKLIFLIFVIIITSVIESFSKKKDNSGDTGENWDIDEFDFSKIGKTGAPKDAHQAPVQPPQQSYEAPGKSQEPPAAAAHYDEPGHQVGQARDAYVKNVADERHEVVKAKKTQINDGRSAFSADVDCEAGVEQLAAASATGNIVDLTRESLMAERKQSRKSRLELKKQCSKDKIGVMDSSAAAAQKCPAPSLDIKEIFSGPNIKKSVLASIILDKPKF